MNTARRAILLSFFLLAACGEEKVAIYNIPKEEAPSPLPVAQTADSSRPISWTTPKEWQEQPATQMLQGKFVVAGEKGAKAEVTVAGFPGDVGGDLANVNRWRGQISLPPIDEDALRSVAQKISLNGEPAMLVDIDEKGDGSAREIFAVIIHHEDHTWFFKMMGDASLLSTQKMLFADFLKSVRFGGGGAIAPQPQPPFANDPSTETKPKWTLPAGWQELPATSMRLASFAVSEGDAKADISVSAFAGKAGGTLPNVNRWRTQVALPAFTDADLASQTTKVVAGGDTALVVEMVGDSPQAGSKSRTRILGAIIERQDKTWFVKMTGDDALVAKQKPAFLEFLKSLRIPDNG